MNTNNEQGWHWEDIKASLRKKGHTFASITREEGFTSCGGALMVKYKPWPAMEKIIADIIGVHPMEIWPSRYKPDGSSAGYGIRRKRSA